MTIIAAMAPTLLFMAVGCGMARKEASMNFDLEGVEPFLKHLTETLHLFTKNDVERLTREIAAIPLDQERRWRFNVTYNGATVPLEVRAFMDDIEAPDLYFSTTPALADAIQAELIKFAKERGF